MPYFNEDELRTAGRRRVATSTFRTADELLRLRTTSVSQRESFDVFLSHCFADAALILGVVELIESQGLSVYVDWIVDAHVDRSKVTAKTAALLRGRMERCASLIFATSTASPSSKWMPWELGYFDGKRGQRISIMPIDGSSPGSKGQEYLGLYPLIERVRGSGGRSVAAAVSDDRRGYLLLDDLVQGSRSYRAFG